MNMGLWIFLLIGVAFLINLVYQAYKAFRKEIHDFVRTRWQRLFHREPVHHGLPWSTWWNRCGAVRERRGSFWGRCELKRHSSDIDHALERGMDIPRWSTNWTK